MALFPVSVCSCVPKLHILIGPCWQSFWVRNVVLHPAEARAFCKPGWKARFLFSSSAHACQTCYLAVTVGDCDFALSNDCIAEFLGGCGKIFFFPNHFFLLVCFIRQDLMQSRLASNLLCSQGQVCTMPGLFSASPPTPQFVCLKQSLAI